MKELDKIDYSNRTVLLGGQERKIVFSMRANRILQKEFGTLQKAFEALSRMSEPGGMDLELLVTVVYAGLSVDKSISKEMVSDWLDEIPTMPEAMEIVTKVLNAISGDSPVKSEEKAGPLETPIGL